MSTYSELIFKKDAIEAACDGADEWDGGYNSERDNRIKQYIDDIPPIDCGGCKWCNKYLNPCDSCFRTHLDDYEDLYEQY